MSLKRRTRWLVSLWGLGGVAICVITGCASLHVGRNAPVMLPRLVQIDASLYRGGQPSQEGLARLREMGIKTIVSLRRHSQVMEEERRLAEQLGMRWVNIPMWAWWRPNDQQIQEFLEIATDPTQRPVFVHCQQGWNRAGIMVAIYRIWRMEFR